MRYRSFHGLGQRMIIPASRMIAEPFGVNSVFQSLCPQRIAGGSPNVYSSGTGRREFTNAVVEFPPRPSSPRGPPIATNGRRFCSFDTADAAYLDATVVGYSRARCTKTSTKESMSPNDVQ